MSELTYEHIKAIHKAMNEAQVEFLVVKSWPQAMRFMWQEYRCFGKVLTKWRKGDKYLLATCNKGTFRIRGSK